MSVHRYGKERLPVDPKYRVPVVVEFRGASCDTPFRIRGPFSVQPGVTEVTNEYYQFVVPGMGRITKHFLKRGEHEAFGISYEDGEPCCWEGDKVDSTDEDDACSDEDGVEYLDDFGRNPEQARRIFSEIKAAQDAKWASRVATLRAKQGR